MKYFSKKLPMSLWVFSFFIIASACAHEAPMNKSVATSDTEVDIHNYGRSVVLHFTKGSSQLKIGEQIKLQEVVNNVGADNIDKIELAVWSDKAFPRTGKSLPKSDLDLANSRIDRVKDFLKDHMSAPSIKAYNMADTSNWLAKAFRTDDAEIKSVFSKDASVPMERQDFNTIARDGAESLAVVVIVRKK